INAGAADVVSLIGLDIEGLGTGLDGVQFLSGAALLVHKVKIRNFVNNGINFLPASGTSKLFVVDSQITGNGNSPTTGGILVRPTGGGLITVVINRTQLEKNFIGVRLDASASGASVR